MARIGKASSNYKGLVYDAGTGYVGYDENRTYWSYGLEAGYEWDMNESTRLDFAARYRALTLEGFTDRIAGDRYEIDDFESHRTHLGLRLNYTGRRGMVPYIGRTEGVAASLYGSYLFDRNSTPQTSLFKEGTRRTHFWNVK